MTSLVELTVENERALISKLTALVTERRTREQEIESQYARDMSGEQQQYEQVYQLLTSTFESEGNEFEKTLATERSAIEERWRTEAASTQQRFDQILSEIDERWTTETTAAQKERNESGWMLASLLDGDTDDSPMARLRLLHSGLEASRTELDVAIQTLDSWVRHVTAHLQKCRLLGDSVPPEPSALPPDLISLHQVCIDATRQSEPIQRRVMNRLLPQLFRGMVPFVAFLLIAVVIGGAIWMLIPPTLIGLKVEAGARDWQLIAAGTGAALSLIVIFALHAVAVHQSIPDFEQLMQLAVDADAASQRWTVASKRDFDRQEADLTVAHELRERKREAATVHADTKLRDRLAVTNARRETELKSAHAFFPARLAEIERIRTHELQQSETRYETARNDHQLRREADFRHLQAEYDRCVTEIRQTYQQAWLQLIRDWHGGLREIGISASALNDAIHRSCPEWSTVLNSWLQQRVDQNTTDGSNEVDSPDFGKLRIGRIIADLTTIEGGLSADKRLQADQSRFELPVIVSLANKPSLIIHAKEAARDAAIRVLQTVMLRFLTTLPAGKVRFTIFDPVGLGANFASFMHLTDIDEQMVTSRIWTEPAQIEKRLADLTEHMETVLQTYLRNEYATLDEYNREAGEVAEPYRILVVANFPANFTDLSFRRLTSIVEGGVKCGVFVLLSLDEAQELPRGFSLADIERHATVLKLASTRKASSSASLLTDLTMDHTSSSPATGSQPLIAAGPESNLTQFSPFRLVDPVLTDWPMVMDEPPSPDDFGKIVRLAGQMALSVRRVEVPFERVMPTADGYWTFSTRSEINIPIGRAGATKHQYLRLGKGTSQHVLIAGKTGSGKSTLLHAFITNAALHYSPDEIEFYLIDFKKGVEFKTYATNQLPHARVIAIESDREFGVSVLQRLDTLLKDRGELYRKAGVQDLAGYRDARPGEPMPRVLLVIDEFQEFFTEDDTLAQSAALLFDRLIRQGRAFGIHVMLGSQTLAGAYSLARSTLGQIAIRIALQCSETDAHLILSEENTAARLLSRPGEAIYNDANGLIEGNHPFQVVWLEDAEREIYLGWMRDWSDEFQQRMEHENGDMISHTRRWPVPVVFEGNIPADALENPDFVAAAQRIVGPRDTELKAVGLRNCWLGEAVALTGATRLDFGPRDGGPVLVIGRDDDAAVGVLVTSIMALAGQGSVAPLIFILDGSLPDSPASKTWRALAELSSSIRVVGPRDTTATLQEIVDRMHSANDSTTSVFVVVYDMARFRDLKKSEDDFGGFGGFDKSKGPIPSGLFAEIVKDGPSAEVFPFVWCDGFQTAQRWLGRELLNRFETRILFAMNANDSSNLIDTPAAGRLGPNRALLYRGDIGTLDKFRPYKAPSLGWLEELRATAISQDIPESPSAEMDSVAPSENLSPQTNGEPDPEATSLELTEPQSESDDPSNSSPGEAWTDINDINIKW